ncbi:MAG: BON domain-containing protein [Gemmataceae bacterium]
MPGRHKKDRDNGKKQDNRGTEVNGGQRVDLPRTHRDDTTQAYQETGYYQGEHGFGGRSITHRGNRHSGRESEKGYGYGIEGEGIGYSQGQFGSQGWGQERGEFRTGQQEYGREGGYGRGQPASFTRYPNDTVHIQDRHISKVGMRGPFTGKGPKGYQRADDRICEDVCERLTQHGDIDASDIEVRVDKGEVTLTGMVDDRRIKRMVEDIADDVSGVVEVHNQIRIRRGST